MKTKAGNITTFVSIGALVVLVVFFALAVERGTRAPSEPAFKPPIYGSDGDEQFITLPLFFERLSGNTLSAAQQQIISDFKRHLLVRVTSRIPLKETEKDIISGSISVNPKEDSHTMFIVDQQMLQFTPDEIALIRTALQK